MGDEPRKDRPGLRRWIAIGISTVIVFFSYLLFIFGFSIADGDEPAFAGGVIGIAAGLVPAAFFCLAAISQRERSFRATLAASLLWVVVGGPIAIVDIPAGLVAGFGAGGTVAMRREPVHTLASRAIVVAVCVLYVFAVGRLVPSAGLMVGAVLPFAAVGAADSFTEREASADSDLRGDEGVSP